MCMHVINYTIPHNTSDLLKLTIEHRYMSSYDDDTLVIMK